MVLTRNQIPEAYLIYALYDQDSNRYEVGKKVLSRNAANQHEELEENLYIQKDGYMETFVVNETSEDVWFDNMMVMSISSVIVQETHYDPWGLELTGLGFQYGGIKANKYLYNGKELIEDNGLQYYDYGARMYDPAIGRWGGVDPMSEEAPGWTPYRYGFNNPLTFTDPTGMFEYVKGGYGEDIEVGQVWSHTEDGNLKGKDGGGEKPTNQLISKNEGDSSEDPKGSCCPTDPVLNDMGRPMASGAASPVHPELYALPLPPLLTYLKLWRSGNIAAKGGVSNSRAIGLLGENAVGVGSKVRIESLTGTAKYRIPDILTKTTLGEVKNVSHLSLTRQLTDFHLYSQQNGLQLILHTRPTTTFSGPLQNLIKNGSIIVKPIPFK